MTLDECRRFARHIGEPVLGVQVDGTVVFVNELASDLITESQNLLDHVTDRDAVQRMLKRCARSATPLPGSIVLREGNVRWSARGSALSLDSGVIVLLHLQTAEHSLKEFVALREKLAELREQIQLGEKLQKENLQLLERERQARARAEEANRVKDELLSAVSHELRTPLQAIAGWIALIRENPEDSDRLARGIEAIQRNLDAEAQLTDDLVDAAQLVSGKMDMRFVRVDLVHAVEKALESARPAAEQKNISIEFQKYGAGECVVHADRSRLGQIFWNLLSNAIKYTPPGGRVRVEVECKRTDVVISVRDNGAGIAPDLLPHVFEPFRRGDGSRTRQHSGVGLGLSIVRQLVDLHGGEISAESTGMGGGSTFVLRLPLIVSERARETTPPPTAATEGPLTGIHILLVEDHDDSREIMAEVLSSFGATLDAVEGANRAREVFEESPPTIVLSDIEMPGEDGFSLMKGLREIEEKAERTAIPAIAVSAHTFQNAERRAFESGFQSFVPKPVRPDDLVRLIRSLCGTPTAE